MNNVTHTPGQWVAEQCGLDEYAIRRHLSPTTAERIATVKSIDPPGTAEANARAIAAAPDMLAALKSVNKLISEAAMTGFNVKDGDWAERLFASQQGTSTAIRKAERGAE